MFINIELVIPYESCTYKNVYYFDNILKDINYTQIESLEPNVLFNEDVRLTKLIMISGKEFYTHKTIKEIHELYENQRVIPVKDNQ